MEFLFELFGGASGAQSVLRARVDVRSEFENETREHARSENNSGRSLHVWVART